MHQYNATMHTCTYVWTDECKFGFYCVVSLKTIRTIYVC